MWFRGCEKSRLDWYVENPTKWRTRSGRQSTPGVDCRVFHVCSRKFISQECSFKSGQDMLPRDDTLILAKVFRTQVHMSSRNSVQNHWHFEHYLQSLCLPVLDTARNRTKIVSWSFPMSLFLGSTVWSRRWNRKNDVPVRRRGIIQLLFIFIGKIYVRRGRSPHCTPLFSMLLTSDQRKKYTSR